MGDRVSMEKRRRKISLTGLFWRYLVVTAAGIFLLAILWLLLLQGLLTGGFIRRADSGAAETEAAAGRIEAAGGVLEPDGLSYLIRYAVFDPKGKVTRTNMDQWHLEKARNAWAGGSGNLGRMQYHRTVPLADGSLCLLQYDYAAPYADPVLQEKLPDFQTSYLLLLAACCLLYVAAVTHHYVRILKKDASALEEAGQAIAQGRLDLEPGQADRARVRELDGAMQAIHTLRGSLKESLTEQWEMGQRREAEITALAHDLKTPLSVVSGNAELLAEEELAETQREPVAAILRNALRAQTYLQKLQEAAARDGMQETEPEKAELTDFCEALSGVGRGLCARKKILFETETAPPLYFWAQREELERAVGNLLDNAARYTPQGGRIRFWTEAKNGRLTFFVQDGGPGFSKEALGKAGTAFYREEANRPGDGHLGLGLYFARRTAAGHGGELRLENTEQGGLAALSIVWRPELEES